MESTAEVGAAVSLVLTSAASLSFCCILTALAPNTQLLTAALLILSAGLNGEKKKMVFNVLTFHSPFIFQQTADISADISH